MKNSLKFIIPILVFLILPTISFAEKSDLEVLEVAESPTKNTNTEQIQSKLTPAEALQESKYIDPLKYTLGPEDVIEITVLRHPEFTGVYPVNLEGKIQYKFVGDIDVTGLNKKELEREIRVLLGKFVISPDVNVTILEYKSKVIYVLGEVGRPGKYFMKSETINVREAVVEAGLPTTAASMRRSRIITPSDDGKAKTKNVDLFAVLYGGELKNNVEMKPGDILYVPATVMAKIMRVISPVTAPISATASGIGSAGAIAP